MNTKTTDYLIAAILIIFAICTMGLLPLMATGIVPQPIGMTIFNVAFFIAACLIIALLLIAPRGSYR